MSDSKRSDGSGPRKRKEPGRISKNLQDRRVKKRGKHLKRALASDEGREQLMKAPPDVWDHLHLLYGEGQRLLGTPLGITPLLRNKELMRHVANIKDVSRHAKILLEDVREFHDRLEKIYKKHVDKQGAETDPDKLMEAMEIGEEYQSWITSYNSVVLPTVEEITSLIEQVDPSKEIRNNEQ